MNDDTVTIQERYMTACTTSSLKVVTRTRYSAADVVAAAGMAGHKHDLALRLFNLRHRPTVTRMHQLADILAIKLEDYMQAKRQKGKPRAIAKQVLAWWIGGTCKACDGTGKERIAGTPHLSDDTCKACNGEGSIELKTANNEAARWLLGEIKAISDTAEIEIKQRII